MALSEPQILRYSRQILLREVGGKGQEALLSARARLEGEGAALETAAAYLGAAGTPVRWSQPGQATLGGFLVPPVAGGAGALAELNPDAASGAPDRGVITEGRGPCEEDAACAVAIGWTDAGGAVVFRGPAGCRTCFEASQAGFRSVAPGPGAVMLGALAALLFHRVVLGLDAGLGLVRLDSTGAPQRAEPVRCPSCAAGFQP